MKRRENGSGSKGWITKNGKKYYRIRLADGKEFTATTKAAAEVKAKEWVNAHLYVLDATSMERQLYPALLQWLEETKKSSMRAGTYESTLYLIKGTLYDHALAHIRMKNLTANHFTRYYMQMTETYAYSTIHNNWTILRQFLTYANKKHWCEVHLDEVIIPNESHTKPKRQIHPLNTNDIHYFKEECLRTFQTGNNKGKYMHPAGLLFLFLLSSGLRVGEALALTWSDVIWTSEQKGFLQINKTVKVLRNIPEVQYLTKTASGMRHIPISTSLHTLLDAIAQQQAENNVINPSRLLFPDKNGNYHDYHNLYRTLDGICNCIRKKHPDFSYTHITLHDLRHSFASALIRNGVNAKQVQTLLGHANIQITLNTYVHIFEEQAESGINAFRLFPDSEEGQTGMPSDDIAEAFTDATDRIE